MPLVEKLGSFYLGKQYDPTTGIVEDIPVDYDSRDLTTHAVCVGMTGSGKTGLCIDLLEEAAIDGVPALIIDPKGDITNLLLTFPELRPEDFRPWINPEDAERQDVSPDTYAGQVAEKWRQGLANWDQGPERVRMLRDAADFAIYTPGSEAGLPISILSSFRAPALDWDTETETLRERIQGIVSALLGLIGVEADPLRSREHILLANIIENAWRAGKDLDIGKLILAVQQPPFDKLGVFELDAFFPVKDRFALAMSLNNLIASPSFAVWMAGDPLDIGDLLRDRSGKPRHSIFYIAHLSDAERMFFVTILLEQLIGWMRAQAGTTSLRALVYMDEIFGFFPPISQPPSKRPLLTLLKQARAFGLGLVLTTQNPADLDYKGLANAGTWFIGKLQTERDKARLMEGLAGALADSNTSTDARALEQLISTLRERVFLLHDVHAGAPVVFQTRWAMSYLHGPLTRQQIKQLMAPRKAPAFQATVPAAASEAAAAAEASVADASDMPASAPATVAAAAATTVAVENVPASSDLPTQPPALAAAIPQVYLPLTLTAEAAVQAVAEHVGAQVQPTAQRLVYEPALYGLASVHFLDRKLSIDVARPCTCVLLLAEQGPIINWADAWPVTLTRGDLAGTPEPEAFFPRDLPASLLNIRSLAAPANGLVDYLYRTQVYALPYNPSLKLYGQPGEPERDFRTRCQQAAREARDAAVDKLAAKYDVQFKRLQDRLAQAQAKLAHSQQEYSSAQHEEMMGHVNHVVGALGLFGRRNTKRSEARRAATSREAEAAKTEIAEEQAEIAALQANMAELRSQMQGEAEALTRQWQAAAGDIQETQVTPRKADVTVQLVALAWAGSWQVSYQDAHGQARTESVPAYPL
jgi:hypothetical protein